jgi:hypothetical protein
MSPTSFRPLFLASIFSSLFVGTISEPTAYPNQYAEHSLRKRAALNVVQTTYTDAHTLDWIPIESQGTIASPPPPRPQYTNNTLTPELEAPGAVKGPAGTVPVPRMSPEYLARAAPKQGPSSSPSKEKSRRQYSGAYWYVSSSKDVDNIGGSAVFSVFDSFVNPNDFSSLQMSVATSYQTVEAGWINYPDQVAQPHLFTYYTTNDYTQEGNGLGGWNQDVTGWVQYSSTIFPGTVFTPTSVIGGAQYEITIEYLLYDSNWWLSVDGGWIGYYPASLFSAGSTYGTVSLENESNDILYYGMVYQTEDPLTTTDMGSGEFGTAGGGQAAYIHNMVYTDPISAAQYDYRESFGASDTSRYDFKAYPRRGTSWGSYVYLGGPGEGGVVGA